ncbi:hypothetical protein CRYUN_Cryun38cG0014400 [Craigia yunnanensis]
MGTTAIVHDCFDNKGAKEFKEFLETKAGVKGLVDAGVVNIPRLFIHPPKNLPKPSSEDSCCIGLQVPLIDFKGLENGKRAEIIDNICQAVETWGFFQVVNHGIPGSVMNDLKSISEYVKHAIQLKETISELLSEALGLSSDCLAKAGFMETVSLACNYYPTSPEPELTLGIASHSDPDFLTLLLQDDIGGNQILHQNKWVDVPSVHGAIIVNLAEFMQVRVSIRTSQLT